MHNVGTVVRNISCLYELRLIAESIGWKAILDTSVTRKTEQGALFALVHKGCSGCIYVLSESGPGRCYAVPESLFQVIHTVLEIRLYQTISRLAAAS